MNFDSPVWELGIRMNRRPGPRLTSALRSAFLLLRIDLVSLSPPTEESFLQSYIRSRLNRKEYVCKPDIVYVTSCISLAHSLASEGGMGDENLEHQTGGIEPACIGSGLFFTGRTFCQAQLAHESGPGKR